MRELRLTLVGAPASARVVGRSCRAVSSVRTEQAWSIDTAGAPRPDPDERPATSPAPRYVQLCVRVFSHQIRWAARHRTWIEHYPLLRWVVRHILTTDREGSAASICVGQPSGLHWLRCKRNEVAAYWPGMSEPLNQRTMVKVLFPDEWVM